MSVQIKYLGTADSTPWPATDVAHSDGLPIRDSGPWITQKHEPLLYYSEIFNQSMKDKDWTARVYVDLFAGPGKCLVRENRQDSGVEHLGSPLKALEKHFTKFIFVERSMAGAQALARRLEAHPKARLVEIWCGDCAEAIHKIEFPKGSLTLTFIDPTKIAHCPFGLIQTLNAKARSDILVNIPIGTDIKRNFRNYIRQTGPTSPFSRYLGCDEWTSIGTNTAANFCRGLIEMFEKQLRNLGYQFVGNKHQVKGPNNVPLYYLFFASKHQLGEKFWNDALRRLNAPELQL